MYFNVSLSSFEVIDSYTSSIDLQCRVNETNTYTYILTVYGSQGWIKLQDAERSEFNFNPNDNGEANANGGGDHPKRVASEQSHSLRLWLPELSINFSWGGFQEQILKVILRDGTASTFKCMKGAIK